MTTIRMVRDFPVAPQGFDTTTWAKGSVHEGVAEDLALDLIGANAAIEVTGNEKADAKAAEAAEKAASEALAKSIADANAAAPQG